MASVYIHFRSSRVYLPWNCVRSLLFVSSTINELQLTLNFRQQRNIWTKLCKKGALCIYKKISPRIKLKYINLDQNGFFFPVCKFSVCQNGRSISMSNWILWIYNYVTQHHPWWRCIKPLLPEHMQSRFSGNESLPLSLSLSATAVAQWLERSPREREAVDSIPGHNRSKSLKLVVVVFPLKVLV